LKAASLEKNLYFVLIAVPLTAFSMFWAIFIKAITRIRAMIKLYPFGFNPYKMLLFGKV